MFNNKHVIRVEDLLFDDSIQRTLAEEFPFSHIIWTLNLAIWFYFDYKL